MTAEQDQFFTKIYKERRKPLLMYAESALGNHAMAEDAVQLAFEIGWRKIEDFQNCPQPEGWIFKSLKFVVSNMKSRLRTERRVIAIVDEYRPDLVAAPADPLPLQLVRDAQEDFQIVGVCEIGMMAVGAFDEGQLLPFCCDRLGKGLGGAIERTVGEGTVFL